MNDKFIKGLLALIGLGLAAYTVYRVYEITQQRIREKAEEERRKREELKRAVKAKIKSKKAKHVDVGLFDEEGNELGGFKMESSRMADDLYVGKEIILRN